MIIMGVDFGDSRTGLAICDKSEFLASPLTVIHEYNFDRCLEKTAEYVKSEKAELIVVGFPKNMNNTIGERAEKCTLFGQRLEEMTGVKVVMWDERCTTVSAHQYLNETNVRGKKRKNIVDAVAAVIILESYLGYRKNTREQ
ncbi:MAG: Holliday junction resolvase RuvX [Oscillospiraceae bacterium]